MTHPTRRAFLTTTTLTTAAISLGLGLTGCSDDDDNDEQSAQNLRFAVISDPHIYDTSLGTSGSAFENYLNADRKMLPQSLEILDTIVSHLLQISGLQAVLISGDLTKDGELLCHQRAIALLQPLRDAGIAIYVVPGNHDINNPHAVQFDGNNTLPVTNITASQFAELYNDFGYQTALNRHENSLSYVAEPVSGLWLLALDTCKYNDNASLGYPETSGAINDDLLGWIEQQLEAAATQGKTVIAMQHHGMVPHFDSQPMFFPEYLIDDYQNVGRSLTEQGLNLVFTGHFHAQDIVMADYNGDNQYRMYDVETGSSVTAPCPYRLIDFNASSNSLTITSNTIDNLASMEDFAGYKEDFINAGMRSLYTSQLAATGVSGDALTMLADLAASLHVAHYRGDENPDADTLATLQTLMNSEDTTTAQLGQALYALAIDPNQADNNNNLSPWADPASLSVWLRRWHTTAIA